MTWSESPDSSFPGPMVDVLVTGKIVESSAADDNITRTILENVRVLAAGQKIEQDREGKPQTVPVITLLVSPEDAAKLAMASTAGKNPTGAAQHHRHQEGRPAVRSSKPRCFRPAAPPAPKRARRQSRAAPPPPSPYVIEVITGNKRENKSFPNQ